MQFVSRGIFVFHRAGNLKESFSALFLGSWHGFKLDLAWMAYCMVMVGFMSLLASVFKSRIFIRLMLLILILVTVFTCIISFADAELNHVWGSKFNSQALEFMKHPTEAMASSSEAKWVIVIIFTLIITFLFTRWMNVIMRGFLAFYDKRWKSSGMALMSLVLVAPWVRGGFQTIPINQSSAYYSNDPFKNAASVNSSWNFLYYLVSDETGFSAESLRFELNPESDPFNQYFGSDTSAAPKLSKIARPNVVVFLLESFSSHTSSYFSKYYNCTPFLDSMAADGLAFTNAYAQGDRTAKGMAALLSGYPGQANQTKSILTLPSKAAHLPGLAQVASKAGYKNMFFYGGDIGFDNMSAYLLSTGFNTITSEDDFRDNQKGSKWGAHDEFLFRRAIDSLDAQNGHFFATILSLSSHEPFEIPGKRNEGDEVSKFLNSVKYTDACIRDFISTASTKPWFNNTIFVFVADHGRKMGLEEMETYQPKFYQIPIIFWGPALKQEFRGNPVQRICSQTDIAATITESIFNLPNDRFIFSRNMLKNQPPVSYYQFSEGFGIVSEKGHVVWSNSNTGITESKGDTSGILQLGKSLQWNAAKVFEKL